jgi:hypothetical protein
MRGYLAREGAEVVGWCNANRKTAYPALAGIPDCEARRSRIFSIVCSSSG